MSAAPLHRRLAAILAADVVGYSSMIGVDETGTMTAARDMWDSHFNPAVAAHGGRIVTMMDDGALVEFASAVNAVDCASAIECAVTGHERLRIAANLGDIGMEARVDWPELIGINPKYCLRDHMERSQFQRPHDVEHITVGLAKAGLPG